MSKGPWKKYANGAERPSRSRSKPIPLQGVRRVAERSRKIKHQLKAIMADLRAGGDQLGGPKPFAAADRSRFLQALDAAVVAVKRGS